MIQFLSNEIWSTIKRLAENSKRTKVAVAYFGTGGAGKLKLKKGDTLILAISLKNVKAGQVNPFEVEKLLKKGVFIYNMPNLHAKIFLFDRKVIVGSSNISENSETALIESGILTDDIKVISHANKFIENNSIEKVEQDYLEVCKKIYNPPKFYGKKLAKTDSKKFKGQLSRLWVIGTKYKTVNNEISESAEERFEKKITNKKKFTVEKITYPETARALKEISEGDIIIEIYTDNNKSIVYPPKRALGSVWNKSKTHKVLMVEERIDPKTTAWSILERNLIKNEILFITKNSAREIKNEETKMVLLNFFNKSKS